MSLLNTTTKHDGIEYEVIYSFAPGFVEVQTITLEGHNVLDLFDRASLLEHIEIEILESHAEDESNW